MNLLKRSLAMLLVLCMMLSMAPVTAFAEETTDIADTVMPAADGDLGDNIPDADQPAADEPAADQPAADEPAADQPAADQPSADQPAADEPAADEPAADEPVTDEPVTDEPVVDEPAADEPAVDEPGTEEEPSEEDPTEETEDPYGIEIAAVEPVTASLSYADTYRILHLDCGRKYFTADWIIALINEMAAAGFTHLELAFGNDGLRFLLDDMAVGTYTDDQVTAAIQQSNKNYYDFGTNELTQSEMDAIIAHANSKGVKIIPLLNNPGHMDAIVSAASSLTDTRAGYNGSGSTVDLEKTAAVSFVKGLVEKYIAYFDAKGCNEFNMGADEYANDVYSTGSMGFGALVSAGKYQLFVNYVNEMAALIKGYGMVPMAFNDGIYFNQNTSYNFDTQIMVAFWTSGWTGYQSASASTMASKGHKMINVNGDYYYVLGKNDQWDSNGYTYASNWNNSAFMGSNVSNPAGSMFCIWCDYPGAETETQIAANTRLVLRAMAAEMQGKDANSISTDEIVPGGFNADGTIAEDCNNVTVKDETSFVEVTGCDLTSVTVVEAEAPAIEGAANVKAWDITPYVGTDKHTTSATVKVPVPEGWDTNRLGAFLVEDDGTVTLIEGTYADGYYTFKMPHFSVGGIYEKARVMVNGDTVNVYLGETKTITVEGEYSADEIILDPAGIVSVSTATHNVQGSKELVPIESLDEIVSGDKYVLVNTRSGNMLGIATGYAGTWGTTCLVQEKGNASVNSPYWTITASGTNYYLQNSSGKYMTIGNNSSELTDSATALTIHDYNEKDITFAIGQYNAYYNTTFYLNDMGGFGDYAGGYNFLNDTGAHWKIYRIVETETSNGTDVIFTGEKIGTTTATVGDTLYTVNVQYVEKTINIIKEGTRTEEQSVTVADYMDVDSVTNEYVTATWSGNTVTFTAKNQTGSVEMIIGNTKYTVNVIEEDLTQVQDLKIEYWQTNARAEEQRGNGVTSKSVTAASAYSEEGIVLTSIIPVNTYKVGSATTDPALGYWRTRLLLRSTNEQTTDNGDDETLNGTGITKVRYWNGSWAVYTDAGEWQDIVPADYQLAAYYMNDMHLADEVSVSTSDWGKKGNGDFGGTYLGTNNVSLAFQVVYEGGTTAPAGTGVELAPYTYFVDNWGNRGVGTVAINQIGDYQIWKITAETGEHSVTHRGDYNAITVNGFTWDNNEMTVWEDAENPVSSYTILNPSSNPNTNGYYDNLRWNEQNESILIRIYIKAVETEDSLKVVYYDEKFGDTLVEYNVIVPDGSNFSNGIVVANTKTPATLPEFSGNADRKDATGYGIVNALDKTQNFRTDLTQVPEAVGKYNNGLYTYTGSVVSDDGMTITHYYTINTNTLSPNFVADFGLPLSFPLSQVLGAGQEELVESVTVNRRTRYGTLEYNETTKTFTYTPTTTLQNIDVLSINIKFTTQETANLTNVGVTPATTVYYEESFLNYGSGWSEPVAPIKLQATEVLGDQSNIASRYRYNYGYDPVYASDANGSNTSQVATTTNGATASFTFTGTGFDLYANCNDGTGYVTLTREGTTKKMYMMDTGLNYGKDGYEAIMPGTDTNPTGTFYNIPIITERNLPHGTYTVTIRKTHNDGESLEIDGFRIYETIDESGKTSQESFYYADKEDKPAFFELRDVVLTSLGISGASSTQVFEALPTGASAVVTHQDLDYDESEAAQTILDHSPKNEVYLHTGQTLTFKVTTARAMQIGLKAPNGATTYDLNCDNGGAAITGARMTSCVDMFYNVGNPTGTEKEFTVSVKNTGSHILAVTLLKVCDDPGFSFAALNEADIAAILNEDTEPEAPTYTMVELKGTDVLVDGTVFDYTGKAIEPAITVNVGGTKLVEGRDYSVTYTNNVEPGTATVTVRGIATASETLGYTGEVSINYTINAPVTPEEPEVPEETTKPTEPGKPSKPGNSKPSEPSKPSKPGNNKPSQSKAEAELKIALVDYTGKTLATAKLTAKGTSGDTCYFKAQQILEAVESKLPGKYAIVDADSVSGVETVYGANSTIKVQVGKVATLKVTYINIFGRKMGTATITKVQTSGGFCVISASEIRKAAPKGHSAIRVTPAVIAYGKNTSATVTVF